MRGRMRTRSSPPSAPSELPVHPRYRAVSVGDLGLVYVDGHLDFYDGVTSPTGEAADMPIAVLLGDGPAPWVGRVAPVPVIPVDRIAIDQGASGPGFMTRS